MTTTFDALMTRVSEGGALSADELGGLEAQPDILSIAMLADASRRQLRGTTVTYVRVARCAVDEPHAWAVTPAAAEVRLTGSPATLDVALAAVTGAKAAAGDRVVSGFSWLDVERLAGLDGVAVSRVLDQLREAGLEALADVPLDLITSLPDAIEGLATAGFSRLRLTVDTAPAVERGVLLRRASEMQRRFSCIQALNPLPTVLRLQRPTTGYDDVKTVALARLAAPEIPSIQVDWLRYGPKLAQVALTFGADDLDDVSPSDEATESRRRAPREEVRRNVEAAGFVPAERDGRFALLA